MAAAHPGNGLSDYLKRLKLLLRISVLFKYHRRVAAIFDRAPLREVALANPRIYEKIYRDYLYYGASISDRVRLLESNYRFVGETFPASMIKAIYVDRNFQLCSIPLSERSTLHARIAYYDRFEKEGEFTLGLYDDKGHRLYSVTFSLQGDGPRTAVVGCLIGGGSLEEEKIITKAAHGMRPKNLIFFVLQCFLKNLGVEKLWAVSKDSHVYWARARRRDRIKFDYDVFWEEIGGWRVEEGGHFILPLNYERRSPQEIRSNKRALYQRRYAMLDDVEARIRLALACAALPPEELVTEPETNQEKQPLVAAA